MDENEAKGWCGHTQRIAKPLIFRFWTLTNIHPATYTV